jgi:hypothetical protein
VYADSRGYLLTTSSKQVYIGEDNGYYLLSTSRKAPAKKQTPIDKENSRGSFLTTIYKQVYIEEEEEEDNRYYLVVTSKGALAKKQTSIDKGNNRGSLVRYGL